MILGTICCRGGSKGIPGKNIKELKGKPLIDYTIQTAKGSELLGDLIISTDSVDIANIARQAGVSVPFMRPDELASDSANKWDVFRHALEFYEKDKGLRVDYLVDMDVTVPLKLSQDIDSAIRTALENEDVDVVITGYEPERNPYFNMMEVRDNGFAQLVKQSKNPIVRRQDAPEVFSLTPAAYVIRKEALYNYDHWSNARCKISSMPRLRAIDIDTPFDFRLVEFLMENKK